VDELGRVGSSRVVESDSVDVGVLGTTGRLAESKENVRLEDVVLIGVWHDEAVVMVGDVRLCGLRYGGQRADSRLDEPC
jgi:hypothetical protein